MSVAPEELWTWKPYSGQIYPDKDQITAVQVDWVKVFAIFPHKTISGRWVWLKPVYFRIVWRYTGFADEPFHEYGDILDVLRDA